MPERREYNGNFNRLYAKRSLSHIPVQEVFYYRQLSGFLFGIDDLKTGNANFHLYHGGTGRKGQNEMCSGNFIYFQMLCRPKQKSYICAFFLALTSLKKFDQATEILVW